MLDSKVLNTDYDLAEMIDLCLPNLLDNADFKSGIINQRGESSYTGSTSKNTYTIDRWSIDTKTENTLTVNDGHVSLTLANNGLFTQYLDHKLSGPMVYAIKLKDDDLKVVTLNEYTSGESLIYDFGELETGVNVKVVKDTTNKWRFRIQNTSGSNKTLQIEYIKLEKGSVFTGMPLWNETSELLKCMRYFQYLDINETIWSTQYDNQFEQNIMFMLPMIKTPLITTDMADNYNVTNVSVVAKDKNRCSLRYTLDDSIGNGHRIGLRINADAETY